MTDVCAGADMAHAERHAAPAAGGQRLVPAGLALERIEHLDRARAEDALAGDARLAVVQRIAAPDLDRIDAQRLRRSCRRGSRSRTWTADRPVRASSRRECCWCRPRRASSRVTGTWYAESVVCAGTTRFGRDLARGVRAAVDQ